ncbi:VOC family protein [Nocardia terpenica]|uniref:Glyoxalase-like domain-containing protein n=1 Tax=Nocardia terpenica TaxID=455432 RepID=A0A291RMQ8_9NOCA|nr:VOC family protein [Nocardia terpenica]ATL68891.1 hypothetical protein CRH09_24630 [Nocardia terpenica]
MIRWNWAFLDRPVDRFDEAFAFWATVTGSRLSERTGRNSEFAELIPAQGNSYLRAQAVGDAGGAHPDFDVDDLDVARARASALGATTLSDHDGWSAFRSPQGQAFCLTTEDGTRIPEPTVGPGGVRSRLDQICLDIGRDGYDDEIRFWAELTGWQLQSATLAEFTRLVPPRRMPVRILLQRLDENRPAAAHVDMACSDREAVAAWHESLGARRISQGTHWTVMNDPAGGVYCLTGRNPETGLP